MRVRLVSLIGLVFAVPALAGDSKDPTWWQKYQFIQAGSDTGPVGPISSVTVGSNVNVSNECGPQSETFIAMRDKYTLAAGSNEIFRLPMRGYSSTNGGTTWTGTDLPLPPAIGANGIDFGSDPSLAWDSKGTLFYSYIVVFFGHGNGINGTEMAVSRSIDNGNTWTPTYFSFSGGSNHFNDKPMITADRNQDSQFRDHVYVAWDAASGGSATGGGVLVASSSDGGKSFGIVRVDDPHGPGRSIGAVPFTGPKGELYVAWNDYAANTIAFTRSIDGGATFSGRTVISRKTLAFDVAVPAESFRSALVYPACDADRSGGKYNGRLYCSWLDAGAEGTDIFLSSSDDSGATWSAAKPVGDRLGFPVDRFDHWLAVDNKTGDVVVSFYDTRNDTTGQRYQTDTYLTRSKDGGATFGPDIRVSSESSNEHDCNGIFPCSAINYGNQQGDYEGVATYDGAAHPIWTDSRENQSTIGCPAGLTKMEEVFSATVK